MPEEMHRRALADEAAAEAGEQAVERHQHLVKACDVLAVVRAVLPVLAERDGAEAIVGQRPDRRLDTHIAEPPEELRMEIADRQAVFQREPAAPPVARAELEA